LPATLDTLVLATRNPGKVRELRDLFASAGVDIVGIDDLRPDTPEPDEGASSFAENATLKARAYAAATALPCLADDSGLEVDALLGAPGVVSSHYAWDGQTTGEPASLSRVQRDARNTERLLAELDGAPPDQRAARFVCVMVLVAGDDVLATARGTFEGRIGQPPHVPRGEHGFGYDPVFLVAPHFERTSAELSPDEKNAHSHRGEAARQMLDHLRTLRA